MSPPSDEEIDLPDDLLGGADDDSPVPHILTKADPVSPVPKKTAPAGKESGADAKEQAPVAKKPEPSPAEAKKPFWRRLAREEPPGERLFAKDLLDIWAPILAAGMVLRLVFASGVVFGIVLSLRTALVGHAGAYRYLFVSPAAGVLAPLEAPAGVILFLLASLYAFLRSRASETRQTLWALLGWILLALFVAGVL